jgi:drug/metabolite transporter (DMT)-like permease
MDVVDIVVALAAAMLLGVGFVLQQHAAEQAPKAYFLRLRLITDLLHRPRWLAGLGVMIAGQLCSAWAVGHLALSLAEPLLAMNLIFALALAVPLSRQQIRPAEIIGAVLLSGGVAALSLARSPGTPDVSFGSPADWPVAAGIAAVAYCFVHAGSRRPAPQRAMLTGIGAGLVFGVSDALTRRTVQIIDTHPFVTVFTSWPAYCVIVAGVIGLWLMQSSFNAAPLHTSLPGITAAQPLTGMLLGVVVFGDVIRISPGMLALQAAGLAAIVSGVILVARAPCLSNLRPTIPAPHLPARFSHKDPHGPGGPFPAAPSTLASGSPAPPATVHAAPANGHAATTPAKGQAATTPANGHATTAPANGHAATTPANGHATTAPVNGHAATTAPANGHAATELTIAGPVSGQHAAVTANGSAGPPRPGTAAVAAVGRRAALIAWTLVAGYRARLRRPSSLGGR